MSRIPELAQFKWWKFECSSGKARTRWSDNGCTNLIKSHGVLWCFYIIQISKWKGMLHLYPSPLLINFGFGHFCYAQVLAGQEIRNALIWAYAVVLFFLDYCFFTHMLQWCKANCDCLGCLWFSTVSVHEESIWFFFSIWSCFFNKRSLVKKLEIEAKILWFFPILSFIFMRVAAWL